MVSLRQRLSTKQAKFLTTSTVLITLVSGFLGWYSNAVASPAGYFQAPAVPFRIAEFKNEPFVIKQVSLGERVLGKQDSLAFDNNGWLERLIIDGTSQTTKEIAYISYGIDFKSTEKDNFAYRLKFWRGRAVFLTPDQQYGDSLNLHLGNDHKINFSSDDWKKNALIIEEVDKAKGKIAEVSIFVETVAFTDDTMWTLGSWLKRSAKDSDRYEAVSSIK